jgi:hypothetical protein
VETSQERREQRGRERDLQAGEDERVIRPAAAEALAHRLGEPLAAPGMSACARNLLGMIARVRLETVRERAVPHGGCRRSAPVYDISSGDFSVNDVAAVFALAQESFRAQLRLHRDLRRSNRA